MWRQRSGRDGDRRRWLDAVRRLDERAGGGGGVENSLDELDAFSLPIDGVGQDDYASMLYAVASGVAPTSAPLCRKAMSLFDRIVHAMEIDLSARQLDRVVSFLLESLEHAETAGAAICAVRSLGCVLYANAERASKWYDAVTTALTPYATGSSRFKAGPDGVVLAQAALIAFGNLAAKAGPRWHSQHAAMLPLVLTVVAGVRTPPLRFVSSGDDSTARLLSSALRLLLFLIQAAAPAVLEQAMRRADELLRLLHGLCTFCWPSASASVGAAAIVVSRTSAGLPAVTEGGVGSGGGRSVSSAAKATTPAISGSRQWASLLCQPPATGDGGSNDSSATGSLATSTTAPIEVAAAPVPTGSSSRSIGKPAAAANRVLGGGSSWYTDSDSEDDDEGAWRGGGGGTGGKAAGSRASVTSDKPRRIPKRVRATALHCLQALAKQDAKLVASRWSLFVPEVQGCHPTPFQPSVLTVMLFDPSMRVREAAAGALAALLQAAPMDKWLMVEPAGTALAGAAHRRVSAMTKTGAAGSSSGLASRMGASLTEAHAALALALSRVHGSGGVAVTGAPPSVASLLSATIRAAGVAATVTPYSRLSNGAALIHGLVSVVISKLAAAPEAHSASPDGGAASSSQVQQVRIAVLHFCSSVFSNDAACTAPPPPAMAAAVGGVNSASRIIAALIAFCGGPLSSVLRAELLAVLARATRHSAHVVAAAWPSLCPVVLQAFGDATPAVRSTALRIIEEVLRSRAVALSSPGASSVAGTAEDAGGGAVTGGGGADDGLADGDDAPRASSCGGSVDMWSAFGTHPLANGRPAVTVSLLLEHYLGRALRDTSPVVRAAAATGISHSLPQDWRPLVESAAAAFTSNGSSKLPTSIQEDRPIIPLLQQLALACDDPAASVRQAAARALGALLCHEEWRDASFARFASALLVRQLNADDNVAVRARASWALGNLCAPPSPPQVSAAAGSAVQSAGSIPFAAHALLSPPPAVTASTALEDSFDGPGFAIEDGNCGHSGSGHIGAAAMLSSVLPLMTRLVSARGISGASEGGVSDGGVAAEPTPPMGMLRPGRSQSQLVDLLSVEHVRAIMRASLRGAVDNDKVACTAVRTLGFGVQSLLLHWLPLPVELRDVVHPLVTAKAVLASPLAHAPAGAVAQIGGRAPAPIASMRAEPVSCPDDELIKAAMLVLADIVAGAPAAAGPASGGASLQGGAVATMQRGPDETMRSPSGRKPNHPGLLPPAESPPTSPLASPLPGAGGADSAVPPPAPVGPWIPPHRSGRPPPGLSSASPGGGGSPQRSQDAKPSVAAPPPQPLPGPASIDAVSAPHHAPLIHAAPSKGAVDSGGAVKVRWNACRAVAAVLPLAHRVVSTHSPDGNAADGISAAATAAGGSSRANKGATIYQGSSTSLTASPPRPRVRKDAVSGASLVFAGVDHVSTAHSPFAPKPAQPPPAAGAAGVPPVPRLSTGHSEPASPSPLDGPGLSVVQIVTDPTRPSVFIGCTWVPPVLAAVQAALKTSSNFKVRIAAAQALATVPSRLGFRIPTSLSHELPLPPDALGTDASTDGVGGGLIISGGGSGGAAANGTAVSSGSSHLSPALQMPGYDAFPTAFRCLLEALQDGGGGGGSGSGGGFLEYKYRPALQAAVRAALLHLVRLAEKLDYGRMKALVDGHADLLYAWLCAEEALLLPPSAAAATASPVAAMSLPACESLAGMIAQPGVITLDAVHAAFRALTALFDSRVKTIPKPLLALFHAKVDAVAAAATASSPATASLLPLPDASPVVSLSGERELSTGGP